MTKRTPLAAAFLIPALLGSVSAGAQTDQRTYQGSDGRYYPCKKSSGTTGAVAGAVGGGLVGHALGGGTLGTVGGAVGGGLLGRHLDKKHDAAQNRKNGC